MRGRNLGQASPVPTPHIVCASVCMCVRMGDTEHGDDAPSGPQGPGRGGQKQAWSVPFQRS